jgi:glycerophosphoryl diester phosphodiesterase
MIFISHRGNLNGVNSDKENTIPYIEECLSQGFDCEVDIRMRDDGVPCLGHDSPDHPVTEQWIRKNAEWLWIHVKDYDSLMWLMEYCPDCRYFCHESDRYTLISNGMIWSHDLSNRMNSRCVIPLLSKESVDAYGQKGFGAVCSDFVYDCVKKFGGTYA